MSELDIVLPGLAHSTKPDKLDGPQSPNRIFGFRKWGFFTKRNMKDRKDLFLLKLV
jgi:hypothetical protein